MEYRLLLDENVEHEVGHRLEHFGHDVVHVDFIPELGKGTTDESIGQYSLETNRLVVTYDDDFVLELDTDAYRAVLYVPEWDMTPVDIANSIHAMAEHYPQSEVVGIERVSTAWL